MTNEKLMKIVQAVNDSKGEPVDIKDNYKFISRSNGWNSRPKNEVHATNESEDGPNKLWIYICTVEEFNQCVKEMSAGYSSDNITTVTGDNGDRIQFNDGNMKVNEHPHNKLISEWCKDVRKVIQIKMCSYPDFNDLWSDCVISKVILDGSGELDFRFKPREFVKGHWYPCLDGNRKFVAMWNGKDFSEPVNSGRGINRITWSPLLIKVGKSLGEIKFGE